MSTERREQFLHPDGRPGGGEQRDSFFTSRYEDALAWARKYSFFQYPFVTACCGMEYMSVAGPRFDIDRFGVTLPRFTPRQSDLLMVVGTITHRLAPILRRVWEQMAEPKWVMSFGACTSSGGPVQQLRRRAGHRHDHPGRHLRSRLSAASRRRCSTASSSCRSASRASARAARRSRTSTASRRRSTSWPGSRRDRPGTVPFHDE